MTAPERGAAPAERVLLQEALGPTRQGFAERVRSLLGTGQPDDETWEEVLGKLASGAGFSAMLLSGQLSEEIVAVFEEVGVELFPFDLRDVKSFCACRETASRTGVRTRCSSSSRSSATRGSRPTTAFGRSRATSTC